MLHWVRTGKRWQSQYLPSGSWQSEGGDKSTKQHENAWHSCPEWVCEECRGPEGRQVLSHLEKVWEGGRKDKGYSGIHTNTDKAEEGWRWLLMLIHRNLFTGRRSLAVGGGYLFWFSRSSPQSSKKKKETLFIIFATKTGTSSRSHFLCKILGGQANLSLVPSSFNII